MLSANNSVNEFRDGKEEVIQFLQLLKYDKFKFHHLLTQLSNEDMPQACMYVSCLGSYKVLLALLSIHSYPKRKNIK